MFQGSKDDPADPSNAGLMFQRLNEAKKFTPPTKLLENKEADNRPPPPRETKQNPPAGDPPPKEGDGSERKSGSTAPKKTRRDNKQEDHGDWNVIPENHLDRRVPLPDPAKGVFHPTLLGQTVLASLAYEAIIDTRYKGVDGPLKKACTTPPKSLPDYDASHISGLPANVFALKTYQNFCETVQKDPSKALTQIVDINGNEIPHKDKFKRTPPPDPSRFTGYKITLTWDGGDGCAKGCDQAFESMYQGPCKLLLVPGAYISS